MACELDRTSPGDEQDSDTSPKPRSPDPDEPALQSEDGDMFLHAEDDTDF